MNPTDTQDGAILAAIVRGIDKSDALKYGEFDTAVAAWMVLRELRIAGLIPEDGGAA